MYVEAAAHSLIFAREQLVAWLAEGTQQRRPFAPGAAAATAASTRSAASALAARAEDAGMFRKPIHTSQAHLVSGADRKKLRK